MGYIKSCKVQITINIEKIGPKKSIRKLMYYFLEGPKMKNVKMLITTIALTLATSASVQAVELVQVEDLNNSALAINVNTELAQSLKNMSTLTMNIEESAQEILILQSDEQFDSIELDTLVAVAE